MMPQRPAWRVALQLLFATGLFALVASTAVAGYTLAVSVPAARVQPQPGAREPQAFFDLDGDGIPEEVAYRGDLREGRVLVERLTGARTEVLAEKRIQGLKDPAVWVESWAPGQAVIHLAARPEHRILRYWAATHTLEELDWRLYLAPVPTGLDPYLVVDKRLNLAYLFNHSALERIYRVATGRDLYGPPGPQSSFTPEGSFTIVNKIQEPSWFDRRNRRVVPGGTPENPLGPRWMGLAVNGDGGNTYGLHGTNEPDSIGRYASDGCVRFNSSDILELYSLLPLGSRVVITNEPDEP